MREIKFRVWNNEYQRMFDNQTFTKACAAMVKIVKQIVPNADTSCGGLYLPLEDPNMVFMQFTGLLDNNGVEIYEDDVVELTNTSGFHCLGVLLFIDGCFDIKFKMPLYDSDKRCYRQSDYVKVYVANKAIEVVGNIHQNPELLKD